MSFQITGIDPVDGSVTIEVGQCRGSEAITVGGSSGIGGDFNIVSSKDPGSAVGLGNINDEKFRFTITGVVVTVTEYRNPSCRALISHGDLGPTIGVTQVSIIGIAEFPEHDVRSIAFAESGRFGHIESKDAAATAALEQLFPFPTDDLGAQLDRFPAARDIVWVQEEPANMGALFFVVPRIERVTRGRHVRTVKRSASASPATGSYKRHMAEQQHVLKTALER